MNIPIYEGDEPYIFISYAHANSPAVMAVVDELSTRGYRIWYDDGIEVGSEWPEYIASHLAKAGLMIAFLSNAYMRSDNCRKEMHFALSKKIPTLNIFLEETKMTPGMEMQVGNLFALMKYTMSEDSFSERLFSAPQLEESLLQGAGTGGQASRKTGRKKKNVPIDLNVEEIRKRKKKRRRGLRVGIAVLLVIAVVVAAIVGHFTGLTERVRIRLSQPTVERLAGSTEVRFQNSALEDYIRDLCGIQAGDLTVSDLKGIVELDLSKDRFPFTELSDLRYFGSLRTLSLAGQELRSLQEIPVLPVEYLDLSGSSLNSLQGIGNLPRLREIVTDGSPLTELGDLSQCLDLRKASMLGAHITDFSAFAPLTKLAEFSVSNASIDDLGLVLNLSKLTDLQFENCDLRGSFFKAFDRERIIISLSLTDCKMNSTANLEDFRSLTTLRLIRSGENLDWSGLTRMQALKSVFADESMIEVLQSALEGSGVRVEPAEA